MADNHQKYNIFHRFASTKTTVEAHGKLIAGIVRRPLRSPIIRPLLAALLLLLLIALAEWLPSPKCGEALNVHIGRFLFAGCQGGPWLQDCKLLIPRPDATGFFDCAPR